MKTLTPFSLFRILVTCFIFTVIIHPGLWKAVASGYQGDHLFNLSGPQISGLVLITSGLALILFLTSTISSYLLGSPVALPVLPIHFTWPAGTVGSGW